MKHNIVYTRIICIKMSININEALEEDFQKKKKKSGKEAKFKSHASYP